MVCRLCGDGVRTVVSASCVAAGSDTVEHCSVSRWLFGDGTNACHP